MSAATATAPAAADQALLLPEHHEVIERACFALLADTYADEPRALGERWRAFEQQVEDHFRAEEELILPALAREAPEAAEAVRADHAHLRDRMYALGIEVDLHVVRARTVEALVEDLRRHATREQDLLYPWALGHLEESTLKTVRDRIARWLG